MIEKYGRRLKRLGYAVASGTPLELTAAHWHGFSLSAGNVIVCWAGPWGEVQVWAASRAEGVRVIGHVAAAPGSLVEPIGSPDGDLLVYTSRSSRNGGGGMFSVPLADGVPVVTSRNGASGSPWIGPAAADDSEG